MNLPFTATRRAANPPKSSRLNNPLAVVLCHARVRDTYTFDHLTTAQDWRHSIALRPGEAILPRMKKYRVVHGAVVACPPRTWASEDLIEVFVPLRTGG